MAKVKVNLANSAKVINSLLNAVVRKHSYAVNCLVRGAKNSTDDLHAFCTSSDYVALCAACGIDPKKLSLSSLMWHNFGKGKNAKNELVILRDMSGYASKVAEKRNSENSEREDYEPVNANDIINEMIADTKKKREYIGMGYFLVPCPKTINGVILSLMSANWRKVVINERATIAREYAAKQASNDIVRFPDMSYNTLLSRYMSVDYAPNKFVYDRTKKQYTYSLYKGI